MLVQVYLSFNGRCEEAVSFYQQALGAELLMLMRNKDNPEPPAGDCAPRPDTENKVLHCSFKIGETVVMASDGMNLPDKAFHNVGLSLSVATEAEAKRCFDALAVGGRIDMRLGRTFWSPCFGMVVDRFGLCWMVGIPGQP